LPWRDQLTQSARPTLLMLLGAVGMVLLIACANVANLTLTRLVRREREFAIRAAMGAGKSQLRKQLLSETLILSLIGAGLGMVVAKGSLNLLVSYTSRFTLRTGEIGLDMAVLGFTLLVAVGAAVLFAFGPGLPFSKDLGSSLTSAGSGRASGGVARRRAQKFLVVSQLAVSFVLLIGAGLLVRSLVNLSRVDPGFDLENVITMQAIDGGVGTGSAISNRQVFPEIQRQLKAYPGVRSVAIASFVPFNSQRTPIPFTIRVEGRAEDGLQSPSVAFNSVSPGYFETIGVSLVSGRDFTMIDDSLSAGVVIFNQTLVRTYFGDDNPLGRRIAVQNGSGTWSDWRTVVGVAADTKSFGLSGSDVGMIYQPAYQNSWGSTIAIRTMGDPRSLAQSAREIIRGVDPNRAVENVATLGDLRFENMAPSRLNATLFSTFALLALVIAAVGIAGVLAFGVSQRTNEFGIRMSLGANRGMVLRMVLNEGTKLAVVGVAIGSIAAYGLAKLMSGLLFQVEPVDPLTFAGVAILLLGVATAGSFFPARRATMVNPIDALKSD
jgi:putative ABC transport system permease protein